MEIIVLRTAGDGGIARDETPGRSPDALVEERFYALQVEVPDIAKLIGDSETLSRLKKHMGRYILSSPCSTENMA